jgi:biopolymer transport protein ExbD
MPERELIVEEVKAFKTQSGNPRFVLRADDGSEYTTFKEAIAQAAVAAEGSGIRPRARPDGRRAGRRVGRR